MNRKRCVAYCAAAGVAGLATLFAGCASTQQYSPGAVNGAAVSVNPEVAERLAANALHKPNGPVRLGASDRFGTMLHDEYLVRVQLRNGQGEEALADAAD